MSTTSSEGSGKVKLIAKSGYTPDLADPGTTRVGAKLPKTNWWVGVGVQDDASMFISVDSGCVSTSPDPHV